MYWVPQPVGVVPMGVVPAGAGIVSFDSWGQATFQQPLQVVGMLPAVLPPLAAGMSGFAGFAKGIAGVVLGGGAALNGNNTTSRAGRSRRQPRRTQQEPETESNAPEEHWHDCQEDETAEKSPDFDAAPGSAPAAAAAQESRYDVDELNDLMEKLGQHGEPRKTALANIRGSVLGFALDPLGCRVVQLALDVTSQKEAAELASELRGHIHMAIESKHGNYVVQKIVEVLPTSMASFMVEELQGTAAEVARHRYGCRILCRLLEHSATEGGSTQLLNELLSQARDLSRHAYGYHVIRCILEHGLPEHRHRIATALCSGVQRHAKHRTASFVVEKALAHCDEQGRDCLVKELLQRPETVTDLARHQFGRHVVSQLVRLPGDCSQKALHHLRVGLPQVQTSKHGRRLTQELKNQLMPSAASW